MNLDTILQNPPKLHLDALGNPISWGVDSEVLKYIHNRIAASSETLETGAGLSTLVFALKGTKHTCIVPSQDCVDKISAWCRTSNVGIGRIDFKVENSENVLPTLALSPLDLILVDGGHGFPIPFIDWFYTARALKIGGSLIVDDTQLWSCRVLSDFLREQPQWDLEHEFAKTTVFRKIKEGGHLTEWNDQPYTVRNSM